MRAIVSQTAEIEMVVAELSGARLTRVFPGENTFTVSTRTRDDTVVRRINYGTALSRLILVSPSR